MSRILVTGGAGLIGSTIAGKLIERGDSVMVLDNLSTGDRGNIPSKAKMIEGDLTDPVTFDRIDPKEVDAVLHLGAQSSGEISHEDSVHDFDVNARGTLLLLRWCERYGIQRFLYASSMAIYGPSESPLSEGSPHRPHSFYGASKIAAEGYVNLFGRNGGQPTIFRMFNVYGPGQNIGNLKQGMASIYLAYLLRGESVLVKGPFDRYRDFIYVDDVAIAWLAALDSPASVGGTYNIGSGQKTTVRELLDGLICAFGQEPATYPVVQGEGTAGDIMGSIADISAARRDLRWEPKMELSKGLKLMVDWARKKQLKPTK